MTPTEMDLIRLVALGLEDKDIAAARGTSSNTVRNQLQTLRDKVGAHNRTQLALYAVQEGIVEIPRRAA